MEDGLDSLFVPDFLTPSQWRDFHSGDNGPNAGLRRLFLALLEISLRDATGARSKKGRGRRRKYKSTASQRERAAMKQSGRASAQAAEALDWIFDDGGDGPFAFRSVCEVLEVDAERLHARIRERTFYPQLS